MAGETGADNLRMVDHVDRRPGVRVVAGLAGSCRIDVVDVLAGRFGAVVASGTGRRHIRMIERSGRPGGRRVAFCAVVATRDVCGMLAWRGGSIVTGNTRAKHLGMVYDQDRIPAQGAVPVLTGVSALNVIGRLAGGVHTVVAAEATAGNFRVVEYCRKPRARLVAIVALVAGNNVVGGLAGRRDAVMTGSATAGHRGMVHKGDRAPS